MEETKELSPAQTALVEKLKEIEKEKYPSADAFARKLGVDPGHLSKVKRGLVPPGHKLLQGLWFRHPETEDLIKNCMRNIKIKEGI